MYPRLWLWWSDQGVPGRTSDGPHATGAASRRCAAGRGSACAGVRTASGVMRSYAVGVNTLTPDQAYSFLDSPAARYFVADLFLNLQISAARHRAEIVGQYERVRDAFNDVDHRVTV